MPGRQVGGFTAMPEVTPTIDTSAYATGDLIGAAALSFTPATRLTGLVCSTGLIQSVIITDLAKQSVSLDLVFFDTNPSNTTFTDNAAFDPHDTDILTIVGVAQVATWAAFNDSSVGWVGNLAFPFDLGTTGTTLYGALVSRGAPTYTATDLTIRVGIMQD